jgi:hypothetical protein
MLDSIIVIEVALFDTKAYKCNNYKDREMKCLGKPKPYDTYIVTTKIGVYYTFQIDDYIVLRYPIKDFGQNR